VAFRGPPPGYFAAKVLHSKGLISKVLFINDLCPAISAGHKFSIAAFIVAIWVKLFCSLQLPIFCDCKSFYMCRLHAFIDIFDDVYALDRI
jgi:hypothetical protein